MDAESEARKGAGSLSGPPEGTGPAAGLWENPLLWFSATTSLCCVTAALGAGAPACASHLVPHGPWGPLPHCALPSRDPPCSPQKPGSPVASRATHCASTSPQTLSSAAFGPRPTRASAGGPRPGSGCPPSPAGKEAPRTLRTRESPGSESRLSFGLVPRGPRCCLLPSREFKSHGRTVYKARSAHRRSSHRGD